jgi:DNA primase
MRGRDRRHHRGATVIPQGFIQDLLARVDIVAVVGRYVPLKKAGTNLLGLCPFHGEKTPSFTVSPAKQFFHCFGCGAHGTAIGFLMDHRGAGYVDVIHELAQQVGMTVPDDGAANERAVNDQGRALTAVLQAACDHYRAQLKGSPEAIAYLKGRGLTGVTAARFALGFAPDAWQGLRDSVDDYADARLVEAGLVISDEGKRYDRFRGRIMFPIRGRRGSVIGFGGRVLGSGEPKYLNSPETPLFHKGQELYGLFEAQEAVRRKRRAIVCEGYLDVIQLAQAGFEETVAALGTAVTSTHVNTLFRLTDHVVFAFDGDSAGRKAARRALEAALPVVGDTKRASFVLLTGGEDPDSFVAAHGAAAFEAEISRALPLSQWFIRALRTGEGGGEPIDLAHAEGRAALAALARPLIETMAPGVLRLQLVQELAHAAQMPVDAVESLFGLTRWRRLPGQGDTPRPAGAARSGGRAHPVIDVDNLKRGILRNLLAHPQFAREFNGQIAEEFLDAMAPIDQQVVEVWRTATLASGGLAEGHAGGLLEALAQSEHAARYMVIAVDDLGTSSAESEAREELRVAFVKLAIHRLRRELHALVRSPSAETATERIKELTEQLARLNAQLLGVAPEAATGAAP